MSKTLIGTMNYELWVALYEHKYALFLYYFLNEILMHQKFKLAIDPVLCLCCVCLVWNSVRFLFIVHSWECKNGVKWKIESWRSKTSLKVIEDLHYFWQEALPIVWVLGNFLSSSFSYFSKQYLDGYFCTDFLVYLACIILYVKIKCD